ncbi:MAG TPA: MFS transporter, partial [Flavobacterium sp.]|nr:MFS transporter [Flavobacterium sp.]
FWADGASCIISISIFALLVKEKKALHSERKVVAETAVDSVFKDRIFWVFLFVSFITAMIFFQIFSTLPLYHHEKYGLTEFQTGLLMTLNGLLIFILEMPIVSIFDRNKTNKLKIMFWGSLMMTFSFAVLLFSGWAGVLVLSIIFMTFGEMFLFPFSNSFALSRAPKGHEGRYMALFTMSFSLAHIMSSKSGMEIISHFGYQTNWIFMGSCGILAAFCCVWVRKLVSEENRL